jgi:outer membrane protein
MKVMKAHIFYALALVLIMRMPPVAAQEQEGSLIANPLTLDGAVAYALKNSPELSVQRLKQEKDEQELSRIRRSKIPDIYLSGDIRRNLIIPSTPISAVMMNPSADPNQMMYMKFNTDWNSGAGVNISYDIFNPATFRQASEQKLQNRISSYDTQISEAGIQADVAQAYAACVISQDQLESLKNDTAFYYASLMEATVLYRQEKISLTDRNNAVIAYNTSIMQYRNAENVLNSAKAKLLYLMGAGVSAVNISALRLREDIPALYAKMGAANAGNGSTMKFTDSLTAGPGLARQAEVIALTRSRMKSTRLKYAPSLSLSGFYGSNYYGNNFDPGNGNLWHGNSYVAASLKIPLTRTFTTAKEVSQLRLQEQIERENLRDLQNRKNKEWLDALNQLTASEKEYEMYRQNYELSAENLKASQSQVDKEYIQNKDYLAEQVKCRNAYQNFLQAAYNVFINTINLQKMEAE